MAYKLKDQKIFPGGLNLLAPGDQVAEGDCLDLQGLWPGAAGKAEVMPGPLHVSGATATDSVCEANSIVYSGNTATGSLYRAGTSIDTGYDSYPLGMISFQGYCWIANRSKQRKDNGTTVSDWTPAAPGTPTLEDGGLTGSGLSPIANNPPLVGGLYNQEYTYYVTWQLEGIGETNPSSAATITPVLNGSIVRIHQPSSPPATATGWNIYRNVGATPYLLNEDGPLLIARTYVDDYGDEIHTHSDTQMLQLGIIMEADHDAAPAARIMANQVYNGRIVVANSAAHPNRIWYTPALQPGFFRGSGNAFDGDWVDVGTDAGDEVRAISVRPSMLIIYRAKSIWRQLGDFGDPNSRLDPIVPELGIVGPHALAQTSIGDFFRGPEGVYRFNMDWAQKISNKVEPLFRGQAPENFNAEDDSTKCALGYENGRLWVSYKEATFTAALVYHVESERWFRAYFGHTAYAQGTNGLLGSLVGVDLVAGGTPYNTIAFQSAYIDCGLPDHEKTFADLVLDHNTGGVDVQIVIRTNKDRTAADDFVLATLNSSDLTKQIIPLVYPSGYSVTALRGKPIRAYNISVRLAGGTVTAGAFFDSPILMHYYVEARQARAFDTDETDHGIQGVKEVDQVELDIDTSAGTASLLPYCDIPGGVMTAQTLEGIVQTTGRQSVRLVLTAPIDGKLLRYTLQTVTTLQLYGMRARILPIGVHLDGAAGEFWQPQPISIGV